MWKRGMIMDLRHIRYFLALAEELNFSRAAERLYISQPPLSRQIMELEEKIGAKLFHRTKQEVELTNAGRVLMHEAYQIIDQVEQAFISTRLSSTGKVGELRIGFSGAVNDIIPTLKKYRKAYPQVRITLKHLTSTEQIQALNERKIDIGNISVPTTNEKIQTIPLKKLFFKVALPEGHPLALKKSINLRDLENETIIITSKSAGIVFYETIMNIFETIDFKPNIAIQAHDLQTVLTFVSSGVGISLTPSPFVPVKGIVMREIEGINFAVEGRLAWRTDNRSEVLEEFLEFFKGIDIEKL